MAPIIKCSYSYNSSKVGIPWQEELLGFLLIDNKDDPICSLHMYVNFSQSSLNFEVWELWERTSALDFKGTSAS